MRHRQVLLLDTSSAPVNIMKFYLGQLLATMAVAHVGAFAFVAPSCHLSSSAFPAVSMRSQIVPSTTMLSMSDFDFPSAMPEKPEQSMKEKLEESATQFIADIESRMSDGTDPPPEMEALKKARDADSDEKTLALRIYELMIEQGMLYDVDAETGKLSPTQFDIKANLDIPEVKSEFKHLYSYGMQLIARDLIDLDICKDVVKERLINRTGLSPEEFDKWLGY